MRAGSTAVRLSEIRWKLGSQSPPKNWVADTNASIAIDRYLPTWERESYM